MKKIVIAIVLITLIAVGYRLFMIFAGPPMGGPGMMGMGGPQGPLPLHAITLRTQAVDTRIELPGRTSAYKVAEIRPQVSGIITERLFKEGSLVKEGQQLYQIDPAPFKAAYNSALADVQKARANLKSVKAKKQRYQELVKIDAISKQEYDDIQASLSQAQADISIAQAAAARAKINVDYTKVYAPIDGRIGKSNVTKGALVTAGQAQAIATITQLDPMYVDMTQSSDELMKLRQSVKDYENVSVTLTLGESGGKYAEEGKLQFHDVTVEPTTGSVQLRALFPNTEGILMPGLFVRAHLAVDQAQAILVPQAAAMRQPDGSLTVWKLDAENKAQPAPINASAAQDGHWVVSSGVSDGDVIVTEGLMMLKPGVPVKPVLDGEDATASAGADEVKTKE